MPGNTKTDIKHQIALQVRDWIADLRCVDRAGLFRFETEVEDLDILAWLSQQDHSTRLYFSDRAKSFQIAAVGVAADVNSQNTDSLKQAFGMIENTLAAAGPNVKYFGGVAFDRDAGLDGVWQGFHQYRFFVPVFEVIKKDGRSIFACNVNIQAASDDITEIIREFESLVFDFTLSEGYDNPVLVKRFDLPGKEDWINNSLKVIDSLKQSGIQKAVLARQTVLQTSSEFLVIENFSQLINNNTDTYDFCFQFDVGGVFVGCSPECLYRRRGSDILTEALAGTRPVSDDPIEQKRLERELTDSKKEQAEHDIVFDDIIKVLGDICIESKVLSKRQIVSLTALQHFQSRFSAVLKEGVTDYDIIEALHPTAAVNGLPRRPAKELIFKNEPFCRGWFAGPVGWIGADGADFAVAIRSGLINGKELSLFAGAGIVKSSDPESEWQETENKMKQFLRLTGRSILT